jgi:hypothetical protein
LLALTRPKAIDTSQRRMRQRVVASPAFVASLVDRSFSRPIRGPKLADHPSRPRGRGKPPKTILDQKWLLVLSGVVVTNLQGNSNAAWLKETVTFLPGNSLSLGLGPSEGPLKYAISHYSIPTPSQDPKDYGLVFHSKNGRRSLP